MSALSNLQLLEVSYAKNDNSAALTPLLEAYFVTGYVAEEQQAFDSAIARYERGVALGREWLRQTCSTVVKAQDAALPMKQFQGHETCDTERIALQMRDTLSHCFGVSGVDPLDYLVLMVSALHTGRLLAVSRLAQPNSCADGARLVGTLDFLVRVEANDKEVFGDEPMCPCTRGTAHLMRAIAASTMERQGVGWSFSGDNARLEAAGRRMLGDPPWIDYQKVLILNGAGEDLRPLAASVAAQRLEVLDQRKSNSCESPLHDLLNHVAAARYRRWASGAESATLPSPLTLDEILGTAPLPAVQPDARWRRGDTDAQGG